MSWKDAALQFSIRKKHQVDINAFFSILDIYKYNVCTMYIHNSMILTV